MLPLLGLLLSWILFPTASAQVGGSFLSPGPLAQDHAELVSVTQCTKCHDLGRGPSPTKCMACHDSVRDQVRTRTGYHANKGEECGTCHPDHKGRTFELVRIVEADFKHDETGFPLRSQPGVTAPWPGPLKSTTAWIFSRSILPLQRSRPCWHLQN